jgi:hypothetical protein
VLSPLGGNGIANQPAFKRLHAWADTCVDNRPRRREINLVKRYSG